VKVIRKLHGTTRSQPRVPLAVGATTGNRRKDADSERLVRARRGVVPAPQRDKLSPEHLSPSRDLGLRGGLVRGPDQHRGEPCVGSHGGIGCQASRPPPSPQVSTRAPRSLTSPARARATPARITRAPTCPRPFRRASPAKPTRARATGPDPAAAHARPPCSTTSTAPLRVPRTRTGSGLHRVFPLLAAVSVSRSWDVKPRTSSDGARHLGGRESVSVVHSRVRWPARMSR